MASPSHAECISGDQTTPSWLLDINYHDSVFESDGITLLSMDEKLCYPLLNGQKFISDIMSRRLHAPEREGKRLCLVNAAN
jgi:hypothetical protein